MIDQLTFDLTVTDIDRSNVGAYLRASDGTLLTHTDIGGKKALDVNIAEGVNVEVDLDHADDSVRLGDGTTLTTVTSNGGKDGLDVYLINTEIAVTQGSDSPWTVDANNLDIRDLTHVSDSIRLGDGTSLITSTLESGKQALDVYIANSLEVSDAALADTAIANAATTLAVAATAQDVVASPLANRKYLYIYNEHNKRIFIGGTGVTSANGFPLSSKNTAMFRAGASIDIEYVTADAGAEIRTLELS